MRKNSIGMHSMRSWQDWTNEDEKRLKTYEIIALGLMTLALIIAIRS